MNCMILVIKIMISIQNVYQTLSFDHKFCVPKLTDLTEPKFDLSLGVERRTGMKHTTPYKIDRHK